jgi:hypothetical protein
MSLEAEPLEYISFPEGDMKIEGGFDIVTGVKKGAG